MSNFKELLFMENDDWVDTQAKINFYRGKIRECLITGDHERKRLYYTLLYAATQQKDKLEALISEEYGRTHKVYQLDPSYNYMDDNFLVSQINKHGYLTGFKF